MMIEFVIIIFVWLFVGFLGVMLNAKGIQGPNFPMISFMLFVPFIPLVAKVCGLL